MPASSHSGGRPLDAFVKKHFTIVGERHPTTRRYNMKCNYCPSESPPIEHRDKRCIVHTSKVEQCPNAPSEVRKEALIILASAVAGTDSGASTPGPGSQGDPIDLESDGESNATPAKKKKTGGQADIKSFLDRPLSESEKKLADQHVLRFLIHAGIPFRAAEHPYLLKLIEILRPLYLVPTRYVLTNTLLPAEEADVSLKEMERLKEMSMLTLMTDGWEDIMKRSVYGSLLAELGTRPLVLGLSDLTGERGTALKILDVVELALKKKGATARQLVCVVTDNPKVMRAFRRHFQERYPWVITTYCFLHALNTNVGRITVFPVAKKIVTMNTKIVTFFRSSHYWSGQLDVIKKRLGVTRSLKTHTATRWYSLILQAQSVQEHRAALTELCIRDDAQISRDGLSAVTPDIINAVLSPAHWRLNAQLIRLCKPLVDAIGNLESRDANLADCMLELIWAERQIATILVEQGDDDTFTRHAQMTIRAGFHEMNTLLHWFALFLHPLSRNLAISSASHSRTINQAYEFALDLASRWNWSKAAATQLIVDIDLYAASQPPFAGGIANAKEWWSSPIIKAEAHPLKSMAIRVFSIVPHSAEIERFFSDLAGVNSPRRSRLTIEHMEALGLLRNFYTSELMGGKPIRRKHAHMHTGDGGLDTAKLTTLLAQWAFTSAEQDPSDLAGPEDVSLDEIEAAYQELDDRRFEAGSGDGLNEGVGVENVYAVAELTRIRQGLAAPTPVAEAAEHDNGGQGGQKWTPGDLLKSLGL